MTPDPVQPESLGPQRNDVADDLAAYATRLRELKEALAESTADQRRLADLLEASEAEAAETRLLAAERGRLLREIEAGAPYRLALKVRALRRRLAPVGSPQARLAERLIALLRAAPKAFQAALDPRRRGDPGGYPAEYQAWIERSEPSPGELQRQRRRLLPGAPRFSLIIPARGAALDALQATLRSLQRQSYPKWEAWVICAASDAALQTAVEQWSREDARIQIAPTANDFPAEAFGEYLAWIDPGDELAAFALHTAAQKLADDPSIDLLYADEDRLSDDGRRRHGHFFKPDWSPDLLRSCNYIHRPAWLRESLVERARSLDEKAADMEGEYGLFLRFIELGAKVAQLPLVLYHNRSALAPGDETPIWAETARESDCQALAAHLQRLGIEATIAPGLLPGSYRFSQAALDAKVSILIPNRDQAPTLERCVRSILEKTRHAAFEILILENNSVEPQTFALYESLKANDSRVKVIDQPGSFNFSKINNLAAQVAAGEYLVFLNNDTEVIHADWIERLLDYARLAHVGAVGAMLYYPDDTIQHGGVIVGMWGSAAHSHKHLVRGAAGYNGRAALAQNVSAVTAACMMLRRDTFLQIGGFDEHYPLAYNDVDLCLRLRDAGYFIVWTPFAELYHYEQLTRGVDVTTEARNRLTIETDRLQTRRPEYFQNGDPYFSPNLTLHPDYTLHLAGGAQQ